MQKWQSRNALAVVDKHAWHIVQRASQSMGIPLSRLRYVETPLKKPRHPNQNVKTRQRYCATHSESDQTHEKGENMPPS
jgi:hypothetical protein